MVSGFSSGPASLRPTSLDRWALRRIQQSVGDAPIGFTLWDGCALAPAGRSPVATIHIRNRSALLRWLWDPELNFGEAYMFGAIEVTGDLVALLREIYRAIPDAQRRWRWRRSNGPGRARQNVHRHYDLGNDFYRLWLDREMVYTCAYFPDADASLEEAQIAKMDRVCRKLQLQRGERVIEAGSGWGALAIFMACRYGARVKSFNVSAEQVAYARDRARSLGLNGRVEFIEDDYRNVSGTCEAFVSVGMLEHVGRAHYETLGGVIARSLEPNGRGLLHFIGRDRRIPLNPWIDRRIFPGAYSPTLREVCGAILEPHGLSVLDVENLRPHYAATLDHWRRRFEAVSARVTDMFDESFVRAWRLYLAGSEAAFETGTMQLFQVVLNRSSSTSAPWARVGD
jgi:cyclopropane-fatty-acyl-phospholipid synthase